jgi:ADP-ribosylglycohydrolase
MYCPPLGAAYADRPDELFEVAPRLSALTHHDERCRMAVLAVTRTVAALVAGEPGAAAVRRSLHDVLDRPGGEELEFLVEVVGHSRPIDGPDRGFCLYAAAVGLQAAAAETAFEPGMRRVLALGGDTDTNAAVAGALLGTLHGHRGLPVEWLDRLQDRAAIEREVEALTRVGLPPDS